MAAFPFGGHPTIGEYIAWAQQQGCTVKDGIISVEGEPYSVIRIFDPSGKKWVTEIGTQYQDFLAPTTVGRFARRLGLKSSPFYSLDFPKLDPGIGW